VAKLFRIRFFSVNEYDMDAPFYAMEGNNSGRSHADDQVFSEDAKSRLGKGTPCTHAAKTVISY
jgi:hypothetical protein